MNPQSFVKLNNIEYAVQQLDALEKTINVDACADLLAKNAPPVEKKRRTAKYVFTIKIVEGEDLKACDPNGTSDPYVVLGDEYQKRLAKTRVVMRSLNPRWDESVDITVQGPLNIIATIWDWDTFGDHDYVGRTSLKLDPSHFSDYMPREYWLNLDTQGRLLLRVSMEGERDDIQFYFGKAFRLLKRTERDMTRKITDKVCLNSHATQEHMLTILAVTIHQQFSFTRCLEGLTFSRHFSGIRNESLEESTISSPNVNSPRRRECSKATIQLLRRELRYHEADFNRCIYDHGNDAIMERSSPRSRRSPSPSTLR